MDLIKWKKYNSDPEEHIEYMKFGKEVNYRGYTIIPYCIPYYGEHMWECRVFVCSKDNAYQVCNDHYEDNVGSSPENTVERVKLYIREDMWELPDKLIKSYIKDSVELKYYEELRKCIVCTKGFVCKKSNKQRVKCDHCKDNLKRTKEDIKSRNEYQRAYQKKYRADKKNARLKMLGYDVSF